MADIVDNEHKFLLRINSELWERFVGTLPVSISANEKIVSMIRDFVIDYERIVGERDENTEK